MASFKKDNNTADVPRGIYKGIIIDFKSKGLKKIKKGYVFESGYLEILLDNGVVVSQYVMVAPYENWIFHKIVKAIGLSNKIDEYIDFPFYEMFDSEIVIELEYESVRYSRYLNITNVYNLVDGEEHLQFQRAKDELRRRSGSLNMNYIEMMNEKQSDIEIESDSREEANVNEEELGDEYGELIDF